MHKAESSRPTDFLDERRRGKINFGVLGFRLEHRMVKFDGKTNLETVKRLKARDLVAIFHLYRSYDADKPLRSILLFNTCRLYQEYKRSGTAIHNRDFSSTQVDEGIINTQTCHGGK